MSLQHLSPELVYKGVDENDNRTRQGKNILQPNPTRPEIPLPRHFSNVLIKTTQLERTALNIYFVIIVNDNMILSSTSKY